jgi:formate hydrogenlyase subunit 4
MKSIVVFIIASAFNMLLLISIAPFLDGLMRKVTAIIQSRKGPPLFQSYYDLLKLMGKEDIESGVSPVIQRISAYLAFIGPLVSAAFIPMGLKNINFMPGDAVLLIYLLILSSIAHILVGQASGSVFSIIGSNREMTMVLFLEPVVISAIVHAAIVNQSLQIPIIMTNGVFNNHTHTLSSVLMAITFILVFQPLVRKIPFDISEAETEIIEGSIMELSGPKLALIKLGYMIKLIVYSAIFVNLYFTAGNGLAQPFVFLVFWIKISLIVLFVTLISITNARLRIDQALSYFLWLILLSISAVILCIAGL